MAVTMEQFARELRAFDGKRAVINEIRKDLRKPLPAFRSKVRASAMAKLPSAGGLGAWVAAARIDVRFRDAGRSAGVRIKMGRKSGKGKAELDKLDLAGLVRHPLYGNRQYWFPQMTSGAGFFTDVFDREEWLEITDRAFDRALDQIRNG